MKITLFDIRCPHCQAAEGPFHIGCSVWFYCREHRVKWLAGYDLSIAEELIDREQEERRYNEIGLGEFEYIGFEAERYEAMAQKRAQE